MKETKHIDYLDGWRGVSILLVLLEHYHLTPSIFGHGPSVGMLGVDCFFVLSGRLMAEILFINRMEIRLFYWRRFSRIVPALVTLILAICVVSPFVPQIPISASDIAAVFTTTANYFQVSGTIGHLWSICVEEHAYFLLSVIALVRRSITFNVSLVLCAIALLCMLNGIAQTSLFHREFFQVYIHSDVRIASVFVSAALFLYLARHPVKLNGAAKLIPAFAILIGCALESLYSVPDTVKYTVGTTLLAMGFNTIGFGVAFPIRVLRNPILRHLGLVSFSVYLWQNPPIFLLNSHPTIVVLAGVFAVAIASFYLVETTARTALNRLYRTRRNIEPAPVRITN